MAFGWQCHLGLPELNGFDADPHRLCDLCPGVARLMAQIRQCAAKLVSGMTWEALPLYIVFSSPNYTTDVNFKRSHAHYF